jgi:hypothetical protein
LSVATARSSATSDGGNESDTGCGDSDTTPFYHVLTRRVKRATQRSPARPGRGRTGLGRRTRFVGAPRTTGLATRRSCRTAHQDSARHGSPSRRARSRC